MKKIFFVLVCFLIFPLYANAADVNLIAEENFKKFDFNGVMDSVPESTREDLHEAGIDDISFDTIKRFSITDIIKAVAKRATQSLSNIKSLVLNLFVIFIFHFIVASCEIKDGFTDVCKYMEMLAAICLIGGFFVSLTLSVGEIIYGSTKFMLSYVPLFSVVIASGGNPLSANAYNFFLISLVQFLNQFVTSFFLPFTGVFTALSLSGALSQSKSILALAGSVKKIVILLLSFSVGILTFFLTAQNVMGVSIDGASMKAASFLTRSFVPIVGGAIKDAISSLRGCMLIIKATVGSFGIMAGILMFLPCILKLFIFKAVFSFSITAFGLINATQTINVLKSFSDAVTIMLSILLSIGFVFIISTGIMISMGCGYS
ncbi:MAG: hypothetical protein RR315_00945 [Oscillospiraceae bacterium]